MKEEESGQEHIPTSKVQRASRFFKTGAKVGANYVKHYSKKLVNPELSRDELDKKNAEDIFESLTELKGSALKVAQMLSMDKNALPAEYLKKFANAQYSAPPLSYPLVVKTFKQYFGKGPEELFDTFSKNAVHAASIGQVHEATLNGKRLAVKIQYPGVADSISTDLRMVKPIAQRVLGMSDAETKHYMDEIEARLIEETDYLREMREAQGISEAFKDNPDLLFPTYYEELTAERVLTMDWVDGQHLDRFLETEPSQETVNRLGQTLWDFFDHQIHVLKRVHADPHPGNFLITEDNKLCILDFGCVKYIPDDFYADFVDLFDPSLQDDPARLKQHMKNMRFLFEDDSEEIRQVLYDLLHKMLKLIGKPVYEKQFDFGNEEYYQTIFDQSERMSRGKTLWKAGAARGPKDGIYVGRVYFGLYTLLHTMKAEISTETQASWK